MSEALPTRALKRRWFRFSLRSFLVLVAITGFGLAGLAYHVKWIHQRREFVGTQAAKLDAVGLNSSRISVTAPPGLLQFLGETGHHSIEVWVDGKLPNSLTPRDRINLAEARRLFPEAVIIAVHSERSATALTTVRKYFADQLLSPPKKQTGGRR